MPESKKPILQISRRRLIQSGVAASLGFGLYKYWSNKNKDYDAIVIGSGASGGWAAKELSEKGYRVLVIEAGGSKHSKHEFDKKPLTDDERKVIAKRQPIQSSHTSYWDKNPYLFVDDFDNPYSTPKDLPFAWIRGRQVGGRTLLWGGVSLRFSDFEFKAASRDGFGIDWPFSYKDIKPHYDKIEKFLEVQGVTINMPQLPDGVFQPHMGLTPEELAFKDSLNGKWALVPSRGASHKTESPLTVALRTGLVDIMENTVVSHLISGPSGKIESVACLDQNKKEFELKAKVVVLCASTVESVRIMLNSGSSHHPNGIGNSSDHLGRYIMDHPYRVIEGSSPKLDLSKATLPAGGANNMMIPKFQNIGGPAEKFKRGYSVWGYINRKTQIPFFLSANMEMLPQKENRITLSEVKDSLGLRAAHIDTRYSENEYLMGEHAVKTLREMTKLGGFNTDLETKISEPGINIHEVGGARMGTTAKESVLNPYNQCWDSANLFVLDGSCFTTSGWQNPTLTIMAIADRGCVYIADYLKRT